MSRRSVLIGLAGSGMNGSPLAFFRAATQRFDAATMLFDSNRNLDAIYLGGYVVECALKSLILERTPRSKRTDAFEEISRGAVGHDFGRLGRILELKGVVLPRDVKLALDTLRESWGTQLRYVGTIVPHREAAAFLANVEVLFRWVERSR